MAQVSKRTGYILLNGAPLLVNALLVLSLKPLEISNFPRIAFLAHFLKRVVESAVVHKFGAERVPVGGALGGAVFVGGFGVWLALSEFGPVSDARFLCGLALWMIGELGNARSHWILANLRPSGSQRHTIPTGGLFSLVSCPHYFFEALAWLGHALMAPSWAATAFFIATCATVGSLAIQKHAAYKKEFPDYPKHRKAIVPFVL
eukprot:TRINITY_DN33611_c0_g1_i1.p2 TRINITY_DN33611_c0_g1~~TRINITY_DN33611_c0_g1_i1.p2  ORF type:complete len:204 (+),score=17.18 TRINITY_DN33611_c0_g1_i1:187-798(+)